MKIAAQMPQGPITSPWRGDFPMLARTMHGRPLAFLDSAASAQKPRAVVEAMTKVMEGGYANVHRGLYEISQNLTADFESVRAKVAAFMGGQADGVVFTRNASEAINLVAQSWGGVHLQAGDEIILTEMEHHANIVPWQLLAGKINIKIRYLKIDSQGRLGVSALPSLLSPRTRLVAFSHVSNVLGTINNVKQLIEKIREYNKDIRILVDGSQGIVHQPVNVTDLDADFYVWTGHKLYGPTGVGILYGKPEVLATMPPWQGGGDMIETVSLERGTTFRMPPHRFEAGTPAIVEVIGLGAAMDYVTGIGPAARSAHESALTEKLDAALRTVPGLTIYGPENPADRAGIFSFTADWAHPSDIAMVLDQCGVAVRVGHHCCMPLMERLGVTGTVRASLALYSDESDIAALIEGLEKAKRILT